MKVLLVVLLALSAASSKHIKPRIIGGGSAKAAQFPYSAALYVTTQGATYFCSGTLYNNQYVITAASCLNANTTMIQIRLGSNSLSKNDPNTVMLATDNFIIHPDFNIDTLQNNIALIKFRIPVKFTDYVKPVEFLPGSSLPEYSSVIATGWGQTSDDTPGPVDNLQFVYVTSLDNAECRMVFGAQVDDNMVCVDGNFNQGLCIGDIGSGLIQYANRGHSYLVGVGSFLSQNPCESTDPSGYTRVFEFKDWILNNAI